MVGLQLSSCQVSPEIGQEDVCYGSLGRDVKFPERAFLIELINNVTAAIGRLFL